MSLIKQYADFILNNLPEWNYSQATKNIEVQLQKQTFAGGACVKIPFEQGRLRIGTEYRKRSRNGKEIKEKEGQFPDIETPSKEAYTKACQIILNQQIQTLSLLKTGQKRE